MTKIKMLVFTLILNGASLGRSGAKRLYLVLDDVCVWAFHRQVRLNLRTCLTRSAKRDF